MRTKLGLFCLAVMALCVGVLPALALPIVELKAVGSYPNPHDITVSPGTPVRLVYTISSATDLTDFQNRITITGDFTAVSGTAAGTWWGAQLTTSFYWNYQPTVSMYNALGFASMPPYSYSKADEASLAFIDLTPVAGTVVVDLTSLSNPKRINIWESCDPVLGYPAVAMGVDLANSHPVVTIHTESPVIPEPVSAMLLALGIGGICLRRRRRA